MRTYAAHAAWAVLTLTVSVNPSSAQPGDLAHCAMAMVTARDNGSMPAGAWIVPGSSHALAGSQARDQCVVKSGATMFQMTYDRLCQQGFEPRCTKLVSVVRAADGKVLFVDTKAAH